MVLLVAMDRLTPPAHAAEQLEVLELLIEAGADPCARAETEKYAGQSAAEIARMRGRTALADVLAALEQNCEEGT